MNDNFIENEWEEDYDDHNYAEEGEGWKTNPSIEISKELSKKWNQIIFTLKGLIDEDEEDDENEIDVKAKFFKMSSAMHMGDAYIVMAKLKSAPAANMYQVYMENATLIRMYAQSIQSAMLLHISSGKVDKEQGLMFRKQIDEFKALFKTWVASFQKDAFDDEWGLFN